MVLALPIPHAGDMGLFIVTPEHFTVAEPRAAGMPCPGRENSRTPIFVNRIRPQ